MTKLQRKRILYSIILNLLPTSIKRTEFMRRHHVFGSMGEGCILQLRKIPLYPQLIHLHNNVFLAPSVKLVCHNSCHLLLNSLYASNKYKEQVGCIEIMDNVFIGSNSIVLGNVRIGKNVIVGAGSVVNKDLPGNAVYAGIPARRICSIEEYAAKHGKYSEEFKRLYGDVDLKNMSDDFAINLYEDFKKQRE